MREFDPDAMLAALVHHDVNFVVIGGIAAVVHGSRHVTFDLDVVPEASAANLARLSAALKALKAKVRTPEVPDGLAFDHDADSLASSVFWNLTTDFGDLDITLVPSGTQGFVDLERAAELRGDVFTVAVRIASLEDVIRSKQAANRPKDQLTLPSLRDLLASRDNR